MLSYQTEENVDLAPLTTIGIGGKARKMLTFFEIEGLRRYLKSNPDDEYFVLGGGSNVLISDAGYDGCVLRSGMREIVIMPQGDGTALATVDAGVNWSDFVSETTKGGWSGVENTFGVPANAGGAFVQNLGAYGQQIEDIFEDAEVIDIESGETVHFSRSDMAFAYRNSTIKYNRKWLLLRGTVRLRKFNAREAEERAEDRNFGMIFANRPKNAAEVSAEIYKIRSSKSMIYDAQDPDSHSVGSFFLNPSVEHSEFERIKKLARDRSLPEMPFFADVNDRIKLSAAWLIERSGFHKSYGGERVALSSKHCLAITNRGGGTADEVLKLAKEVEKGVDSVFGVRLKPELTFLGLSY